MHRKHLPLYNIDQVITVNNSTSEVLTASQNSVILMPDYEADVGTEWYLLANEITSKLVHRIQTANYEA